MSAETLFKIIISLLFMSSHEKSKDSAVIWTFSFPKLHNIKYGISKILPEKMGLFSKVSSLFINYKLLICLENPIKSSISNLKVFKESIEMPFLV